MRLAVGKDGVLPNVSDPWRLVPPVEVVDPLGAADRLALRGSAVPWRGREEHIARAKVRRIVEVVTVKPWHQLGDEIALVVRPLLQPAKDVLGPVEVRIVSDDRYAVS